MSHADISPAIHYFAQCYKDIVIGKTAGMAILPQSILSYTGKSYHNIYSIQPMHTPQEQPKPAEND